MKYQILTAVALGLVGLLQAQTVPTPPQTDEIIIDTGAPGKADPGDRIRYKVTIQNTGGSNANGAQLNIVPDPRTTFVPGSFRSSPLALPDAYACTGNVGISVPAASGLLANDFDDNPAGLTATIVANAATTQGGSITIAADGSFSYTPPAGFTGNDTYTYTLNDGNPVTGVTATDMSTVTFTVSNMIWFVDNTGGGSGGTGALSNPFKTLGDFNASAGPLAGHLVFIRHTGTNYGGGIVLKDNMTVFGSGHTGGANLADVLPFSLAANSLPLPAINGTRPIITNASGDGVTLASGNALRGLDVGACSDFGMDNSGANSVGNLVVSELSINNTTGGGFDASHGSGASMNAVFTSISSSGGVNGINLTNCAGTFTVNGGTITNPTGTGVLISGGSVTFSCAAAVSDNTGFAVDVDNHDSNNATFSGAITTSGTGIRVQNCGGGTKTFSGNITTTAGTAITASNNNGGTINFSGGSKSLSTGASTAVNLTTNTGAGINFTGGGLVITTTSGTGFNATGGGTITVQGTGNTISSTTGTALNVANTTIGASGLTFQSVSHNGGVSGIVLNTTGASGGLTVTGSGNTFVGGDNSGGAIQNTTGAGISLTSTLSPSFTNMRIQNTAGSGVSGASVTNFTFKNGKIDNSGTGLAAQTSNIAFNTDASGSETNLTGNVTITNNELTNAYFHGISVKNFGGTITDLNVSGNTITSSTSISNSKGSGIQFNAFGGPGGSTTASISKATINGNIVTNFPSDAGIMVIGGNATKGGASSTMGSAGNPIAITNNIISGQSAANRMGTQGILFNVNGTGTGNFNVSGNSVFNTVGNSISHNVFGDAVVVSTISNNNVIKGDVANTLGTSGIVGGTSFTTGFSTNTPSLTVTITGNNITGTDGNGILMVARDNATGQLNISVKNNTVAAPLGGVRPGIRIDAGNSAAGSDNDVCLDISGNISAGSGGSEGIGLRKQGTSITVNAFGVEGMAATSTPGVEAYVAGLNPMGGGVLLISATSGFNNCVTAP